MRRVATYGGLMLLTMAAGLTLRFGRLGLAPIVVKYGGSTMWALMIYWVMAAVRPRWRALRVLFVAGLIATAVEFLKLYHAPGLDAFRLTLPGVLLLGRYFSVWDLVAYWMAIAVGTGIDSRVIRPD